MINSLKFTAFTLRWTSRLGPHTQPLRHRVSELKRGVEARMSLLLEVLLLYLLLGLAFLGWGRATEGALHLGEEGNGSWLISVWLGWAVALLIFQILHFVLPVTAYVVVPVLVLGIAFSILPIKRAVFQWAKRHPIWVGVIGELVLWLAAAGWFIVKSITLGTDLYDAGLYGLSAIRWIETFATVPGLGNLHGRLAFNSSFLTFASALNFHPFFDHGFSIAVSFLFVLTIATLFEVLAPVVKHPASLLRSHPFEYAPALFALPWLAYVATGEIASPDADLASTLIELVLFVVLCQGIAQWIRGNRNQSYRAAVMLILAATAVTIKLSNLVFAVTLAGFVVAYWLSASRPAIQSAARMFVPPAFLTLVWLLQGFVLSGAPLYPSTIGYIPVDWAVPKAQAISDADWIYSWARTPGQDPSKVLGNWNWLGPWLQKESTDFVAVVDPLKVSGLFCLAALLAILFNRKSRPRALEWGILAPLILGLLYWFFTAPDPRFANALFYLLATAFAVLFLLSIQGIVSKPAFAVLFLMAFLVGNFYLFQFVAGHVTWYRPCISSVTRFQTVCIRKERWTKVPRAPLAERVTDSGLLVYVPSTGDECWDAPLPCTPNFSKDLRLRTPGDLAAGFTLRAP